MINGKTFLRVIEVVILRLNTIEKKIVFKAAERLHQNQSGLKQLKDGTKTSLV